MGGAQWQGPEVVFPEVAVGLLAEENFAGVLRLQVAHEVRDGAFAQGFEDEVDVIGHQTEGMDADFVTAGEAIETVEVGEQLGLGVEDALAAVAALVDVIALAAFERAQRARGWLGAGSSHIDKSFERGIILTYFQKYLRPEARGQSEEPEKSNGL